ncbi:MAG: pyruvate ferredoxin oxidoreductase [Gammaproteobacteria bacterium]|nr:pyruvate ferredoxin oxidoreductase [Gammaproteobacteria bacterium]MCP5135667.1 pyruvate ferredoxin oxidoreductase [Gammaproteobacteria bacterium]
MIEALEGSQALARAVVLCRPGVVAAYPITPQTHIVENISKLVADGVTDLELVSVESEFSAASVAMGAAAAGSRAYTASASQGILLMSEVLFNISGLRIPLVMHCANRAIGAPLNIWNDQSDSMAVRDAGWIQIYCADNQEAIDSTVQAYRIAERTELPVMVCVDGFTLTHTLESLELPSQEQVDGYLPDYVYRRSLNVRQPISQGTLVGPDVFPEARHSHHQALINAIPEIERANADWAAVCGRDGGALLTVEGDPDAEIGILAIGSTIGTLAEAMEEFPDYPKVRLIKLRVFRPFPIEALRAACAGLRKLAVIERAFSAGMGGIVGTEVRANVPGVTVYNYAIGLGGRDIPLTIYPRILDAIAGDDTRFQILDVDLSRLPEEDR